MTAPNLNLENPDEWPYILTCPQVAKILKISKAKAYRMAKNGELPAKKFGKVVRVPREAFKRWLEGEAS